MAKNKPSKPKPRGVWKINPVTRIKPNTKKNVVQRICGNCDGQGLIRGSVDPKTGTYLDCQLCSGTGVV